MNETASLVKKLRQNSGHPLRELARRAKTSAAAIVDYEAGRHEVKLSTLRRLAEAAGCDLVVEIRPRLTSPERRTLEMHRAVAAHFQTHPERIREIARRNLQVMRDADREGHGSVYLEVWEDLLSAEDAQLIEAMTSTDQPARALRQASPFAGVLDDEERLVIVKSSTSTPEAP